MFACSAYAFEHPSDIFPEVLSKVAPLSSAYARATLCFQVRPLHSEFRPARSANGNCSL